MVRRKQGLSLTDAAQRVSITGYLDVVGYLRALYQQVKEANSPYSYRHFAEELGFGFTNYMHLVLTGKREISLEVAAKVVEKLGMKRADRDYFMALIAYHRARDHRQREILFGEIVRIRQRQTPQELDQDMLAYLSEWYHPVVRELVQLPEFKDDPRWVAQTIRPTIPEKAADASLKLLKRLQLIVWSDEKNRWVQRDPNVTTGPMIRGLGVKRYHQQMMILATDALLQVPAARRDYQALTFAVDDELMDDIRRCIDDFWHRILEKTTQPAAARQIYQLNIQFFPVSEELKTPTSEKEKTS